MKRLLLLTMLLVLVTYAFACDMFAGMASDYWKPNTTVGLSYHASGILTGLKTHSQTGLPPNPDGCGFGMFGSLWQGAVVFRDPLPIYDPNNSAYLDAQYYLNLGNQMQVRTFLGHARNRTSGPVGGVHPFQWNSRTGDNKTYLFEHNGSITSLNSSLVTCLNDNGFNNTWINDAYYDCHNGYLPYDDVTHSFINIDDNITDSELIFYLIMGMNERYGSIDTALNQALYALTHTVISGHTVTFSSLNSILTDGETIFVYRNVDVNDNGFHNLYYTDSAMNNDNYCFYANTLNNTTVPGGWELMNTNDQLVRYNKHDAQISVINSFAATAKEKTNFIAGIDWRCFPVMGSIVTNTVQANTYFSDMVPSKFNNILNPTNQYYWADLINLPLERDKGYILTMNTATYFDMKGTLTPANYPVSLSHGVNWIGYFQKGSSEPLVALTQILPYITSIQSQDWFMYKNRQGQWQGGIQGGKSVTMNYGEMYKVDYTPTTSTTFTYGYQPAMRSELPIATMYIPEEKTEYAGVVIDSLSGIEDINEVALLKDGEIIGSAKFVDYPIYIKAYTDDVSNLDMEVLTNSKSAGISVAVISNANLFCSRIVNNIYQISNVEPIVSNLPQENTELILKSSIYPNPFNSKATINYTLSKSIPVNVTIYNVRGQLVKTLSNPSSKTGINAMSWDGTDQAGKITAAGVYLYKISAGNKTLTSKVLRIK